MQDEQLAGLEATPNAESGRRLFQSPTSLPSTITVMGSMDIEPQLEPGTCARFANYGVRASILLGTHNYSAMTTASFCR